MTDVLARTVRDGIELTPGLDADHRPDQRPKAAIAETPAGEPPVSSRTIRDGVEIDQSGTSSIDGRPPSAPEASPDEDASAAVAKPTKSRKKA